MIGPVGTPGVSVAATGGVGATKVVKLQTPGLEVGSTRARPSIAAELAGQGTPVDRSRVADLRAAITEGRYVVDSRKIADAMIASETPAR